MRKFCLCIALLFALSLAPVVADASTYKDFVAAWTERDARYVEQHATLDKQAREATATFMATAATESPPDLNVKMEQMVTAIQAASYAGGRGMMLRDLRTHFEKKPSAAATELWLQERVDGIRTEAGKVDAKFVAVQTMRDVGSAQPLTYLQEVVFAVTMAGNLHGKIDELRLLDQNLSSYFQAKGQEDVERREARARIFGAIGASLTAYGNSANRPWTATCTRLGNRTNCTGF